MIWQTMSVEKGDTIVKRWLLTSDSSCDVRLRRMHVAITSSLLDDDEPAENETHSFFFLSFILNSHPSSTCVRVGGESDEAPSAALPRISVQPIRTDCKSGWIQDSRRARKERVGQLNQLTSWQAKKTKKQAAISDVERKIKGMQMHRFEKSLSDSHAGTTGCAHTPVGPLGGGSVPPGVCQQIFGLRASRLQYQRVSYLLDVSSFLFCLEILLFRNRWGRTLNSWTVPSIFSPYLKSSHLAQCYPTSSHLWVSQIFPFIPDLFNRLFKPLYQFKPSKRSPLSVFLLKAIQNRKKNTWPTVNIFTFYGRFSSPLYLFIFTIPYFTSGIEASLGKSSPYADSLNLCFFILHPQTVVI